MGQWASKRKVAVAMEGEFDSCAPLPKRLKPNVLPIENDQLDITPIKFTYIDLYNMYPSLLRNLTSFEQSLFQGLDQLEEILKYKFNNRIILLETTTHKSFQNPLCSSYDKLEYLGDIKLGSVLSDYSFRDSTKNTPGEMTEIRSKVLCNDALGVVVVRHGLHTFLKNNFGPSKQQDIAHFLQNQQLCGHKLMDDQLSFEPTGIANEQVSVRVEIPKELGDLFEALAGAVFIDSGCSYETLWRIFSPFLKHGLMKAMQNSSTVIQQVERLHPTSKFKDLGVFRNRRLAVLKIGKLKFKGSGFNFQTAKKAAATYALKFFDPLHHGSVPAPLRGV